MKIVAAVMALASVMLILTACGKPVQFRANNPAAPQTVQSEQNVDQSEAVNVVKNMIRVDYTKYKIDLINKNLEYNGNEYYQFLISNNEASIEPSIIVSKNDGAILCYYPDSTVTEVDQDGIFKSKL
jgi:phosphatidate phosphatase PAH1